MKTIYDKPLTLDELIELATQRRKKLLRDHVVSAGVKARVFAAA